MTHQWNLTSHNSYSSPKQLPRFHGPTSSGDRQIEVRKSSPAIGWTSIHFESKQLITILYSKTHITKGNAEHDHPAPAPIRQILVTGGAHLSFWKRCKNTCFRPTGPNRTSVPMADKTAPPPNRHSLSSWHCTYLHIYRSTTNVTHVLRRHVGIAMNSVKHLCTVSRANCERYDQWNASTWLCIERKCA